MKEFKGTPWPWKWVEAASCDLLVSESTDKYIMDDGSVGGEYDSIISGDTADGKLIAAAPELLEALQNMIGAFDNPITRRKLPSDFNTEAIEISRSAISKALGDS